MKGKFYKIKFYVGSVITTESSAGPVHQQKEKQPR